MPHFERASRLMLPALAEGEDGPSMCYSGMPSICSGAVVRCCSRNMRTVCAACNGLHARALTLYGVIVDSESLHGHVLVEFEYCMTTTTKSSASLKSTHCAYCTGTTAGHGLGLPTRMYQLSSALCCVFAKLMPQRGCNASGSQQAPAGHRHGRCCW